MTFTVAVEFTAQDLDWENIETALGYLSKKLISYQVNRSAAEIQIECHEEDRASLEEQIGVLLKKLQPANEELQSYVLFDQGEVETFCKDDIFSILLENREVIPHGKGIYSLHGRTFQLLERLDRKIKDFGLSLGAEEVLFPVTIGLEPLQKINFFAAYPHFANFVSTVKEEHENISEFSQAIRADKEFEQCLNTPRTMCRSAGCLHSYPCYENQVLEEGWSKCITMMGRIFRNESSNVVSLERLNEFSMREFIFMGSQEFVDASLARVLDWWKLVMKESPLRGTIQSANDPFFADNLAALQFFQRSQQSKSEVRLINPFNERAVSVSSFNNHTTHFSKSYNIKFESGDYISTGCVGFGLERLVFLLLSQFGLDESRWPPLLQP